jgi:hypothetical protein
MEETTGDVNEVQARLAEFEAALEAALEAQRKYVEASSDAMERGDYEVLPLPDLRCDFCARSTRKAGRMIESTRSIHMKPNRPAVHICRNCVERLGGLFEEEEDQYKLNDWSPDQAETTFEEAKTREELELDLAKVYSKMAQYHDARKREWAARLRFIMPMPFDASVRETFLTLLQADLDRPDLVVKELREAEAKLKNEILDRLY